MKNAWVWATLGFSVLCVRVMLCVIVIVDLGSAVYVGLWWLCGVSVVGDTW